PTPSHATGAPADLAPAEALQQLYDGTQSVASGKPRAENRDRDRVRALAAAVTQNVRNQALLLAESSPVIGRLLRQGELIIAGGVYDLKTGVVTPVEIAV
ncbi:MAG: hypothetical protein ACK5X8_19755, partial [Planctomyces sp.]